MRELLFPLSNFLSFVGGALFSFWLLRKAKEKLLDVPESNVTVQDIAEWVKRKSETDALIAAARETRQKFLARG
jgi:hypothetical protein